MNCTSSLGVVNILEEQRKPITIKIKKKVFWLIPTVSKVICIVVPPKKIAKKKKISFVTKANGFGGLGNFLYDLYV